MGRFVDAIRCNILEKYMASYMRERSVDALLILRNENKWAMTGNFLYFSLTFFLILFLIDSFLQCGYYVVCSFLVADVEVKGDGVFIRLRKEGVVCEDKDSSTRVSSSDVHESVVERVPECSGSEVAVSLEAIPEDLTFESGEAFSLEGVDNIPMEELFCGSHGEGSAAGSSDITSISLDTVLDLNLAS
jgi:hypothetical protein